jgi:hypothetical protein
MLQTSAERTKQHVAQGQSRKGFWTLVTFIRSLKRGTRDIIQSSQGPIGMPKHFNSLKLWIPPCPITVKTHSNTFFFLWRCGPTRAMASSFFRFPDQTQWCITVGRTPLDEWSVRHRELYLKIRNTHNRQTSMPPVGFETTVPASERL